MPLNKHELWDEHLAPPRQEPGPDPLERRLGWLTLLNRGFLVLAGLTLCALLIMWLFN